MSRITRTQVIKRLAAAERKAEAAQKRADRDAAVLAQAQERARISERDARHLNITAAGYRGLMSLMDDSGDDSIEIA
jgi:hypothetical protein